MMDDESYLLEKLKTRLLVRNINLLLLENEDLKERLETAYENFESAEIEGLREEKRLLKESLEETNRKVVYLEELLALLKSVLSIEEV